MVEASVCGDVERKRRLADAGTRRKQDKLARLEPVGHVVEGREVGVDEILWDIARLCVLYGVHRLAERLLGVHEFFVDDVLGDGIDLFLRAHEGVGAGDGIVARAHDVVARRDDAADERVAFDDVRIVVGTRGGGDALGKIADVLDAARLFQLAVDFQPVGERNSVNRRALFHERTHGDKDEPVGFEVKVLFPDVGDELVRDDSVDEQRAEQRVFGVGVVGHRSGNHILFHLLLLATAYAMNAIATATATAPVSTAYQLALSA